ncbi:hypothetical protein [Paracoccus jiaweipingae]|uniref:hypothetical protein n=1 Tax=Paracoccus sp. p2-l61 TaxID=3366950 RepID=UPI00379AC3B2
MFTFVENYEFDWPVAVQYPGASGDREATFTARFRLVEEDELFRSADAAASFIERLAQDREKWADRWIGWDGIRTEDGADLPFSPESRDRLLRQRPIREAILRAYSDAVIYGGVEEKN